MHMEWTKISATNEYGGIIISGDLLGPFQLLFAALGFGKYAYNEIKEGNRVANQIVFEKKFYDQYTDWNLEDSYFEAMKDPNNYDALWERVERYKEEGGKKCLRLGIS